MREVAMNCLQKNNGYRYMESVQWMITPLKKRKRSKGDIERTEFDWSCKRDPLQTNGQGSQPFAPFVALLQHTGPRSGVHRSAVPLVCFQ